MLRQSCPAYILFRTIVEPAKNPQYHGYLHPEVPGYEKQIVARDANWMHNDPAHSDCDRANADSHLRAIVAQFFVLPGELHAVARRQPQVRQLGPRVFQQSRRQLAKPRIGLHRHRADALAVFADFGHELVGHPTQCRFQERLVGGVGGEGFLLAVGFGRRTRRDNRPLINP